jgi:hypothetical protein
MMGRIFKRALISPYSVCRTHSGIAAERFLLPVVEVSIEKFCGLVRSGIQTVHGG